MRIREIVPQHETRDARPSALPDTPRVLEKRLTTRERSEPEARERLRREARLLRALEGRATPRFVDAGEDANGPWLRMEKIEMPTLAHLLEHAPRSAFDTGWLERAAEATYSALAILHDAADAHGPLHVVHSDLSPANIALDDHARRAIVLDLELATWREAPPRDGAFRGTVGYIAPEVARGDAPTIAGDLFALAAALVHTGSGVVPRTGPSLAAVVVMAAERPLLDESSAASAFLSKGDARVHHALLHCLAHDPRERPPSAQAVLALFR